MPLPKLSRLHQKFLLSALALVIAIGAFTDTLDRVVERTPVARLDARASAYFDGP